jgi:hypothetical protein
VKLLDQLFLVLFARVQRDLCGRNREAAWHRAFNAFSSYLVLPTIAAVGLVILTVRVLAEPGMRSVHKLPWQIAGMVVLGGVYICLYRRFRKYLHDSPIVPPEESVADGRFIRWSRIVSVGAFVLVFATAVLVHFVAP